MLKVVIYSLCLLLIPIKLLAAPEGTQANQLLLTKACSGLGSLCNKYKTECTSSGNPSENISACMGMIYFEHEVAKERCGLDKYIQCIEENNEYRLRWMHELNIPNIGNPKRNIAFAECKSNGLYSVKSEFLTSLEREVINAVNVEGLTPPLYRNEKAFFECFDAKLK
ncbi:MAG: hypothetical protein ACPF9K_07990 [Neptuniibacter sp.]